MCPTVQNPASASLCSWVTAIGGLPPDRLGPALGRWSGDAEALGVEAAAVRPARP
jgi:hypothetical protein